MEHENNRGTGSPFSTISEGYDSEMQYSSSQTKNRKTGPCNNCMDLLIPTQTKNEANEEGQMLKDQDPVLILK